MEDRKNRIDRRRGTPVKAGPDYPGLPVQGVHPGLLHPVDAGVSSIRQAGIPGIPAGFDRHP